jgi:DNA-binding IclR family transcriptional regulator
VTPEGTAAVEAIVRENRRVTVNEIAAHLDMSHGSARRIVCDVLQFYKYLIFNNLTLCLSYLNLYCLGRKTAFFAVGI